jgi:hypothetical protein
MDKSNTFVTMLGKKENDISNVMNISISLIGMLTHGHKIGYFGYFTFLFIDEFKFYCDLID